MRFNDIEKKRINRIVGGFCEERIPDHQRSQVKLFYTIKGYEVRIIESRPSFPNNHLWTDSPVARLVYDPNTLGWELYWSKASSRWKKYPGHEPTNNLKSLIDTIAEDRFQVFLVVIGWEKEMI